VTGTLIAPVIPSSAAARPVRAPAAARTLPLTAPPRGSAGARAALAIAKESGRRDIAQSAALVLAQLEQTPKRPSRRLFGR